MLQARWKMAYKQENLETLQAIRHGVTLISVAAVSYFILCIMGHAIETPWEKDLNLNTSWKMQLYKSSFYYIEVNTKCNTQKCVSIRKEVDLQKQKTVRWEVHSEVTAHLEMGEVQRVNLRGSNRSIEGNLKEYRTIKGNTLEYRVLIAIGAALITYASLRWVDSAIRGGDRKLRRYNSECNQEIDTRLGPAVDSNVSYLHLSNLDCAKL